MHKQCMGTTKQEDIDELLIQARRSANALEAIEELLRVRLSPAPPPSRPSQRVKVAK